MLQWGYNNKELTIVKERTSCCLLFVCSGHTSKAVIKVQGSFHKLLL